MKKLLPLFFFLFFVPSAHAALIDNLVSYWKLDESSGNAADSVGSNTMTNSGTVSFAAGKINNAATFDGTNYLSKSSQVGLPTLTSSFSMQAWVNFTATNSRSKGIFSGDGDWSGFLADSGQSNGKVQFGFYNGSSFYRKYSSSAINDGSWHHVVGVRDRSANTIELFIDGVSQGTVSTSGDPVKNGSTPAYIGSLAGDNWIGSIDEVAYWSRALTSTEVEELYASGSGLQYPFASQIAAFQLWPLSLF